MAYDTFIILFEHIHFNCKGFILSKTWNFMAKIGKKNNKPKIIAISSGSNKKGRVFFSSGRLKS